jgi:endonuclease-8
VLANDEWAAVGYRVHDLALVATADEEILVGHLGPDLLGPDWDPDEAVRRLAAQPDRPIGEALLDQRSLAGVGNMYKVEVLFLHRLNPWSPTGAVPDLRAVVVTAHRLLHANREHPAQSTTGSLRRGEQHWVYGRAGRPCRPAVPPLRTRDPGGRPGSGAARAGDVLVPDLPAGRRSGRLPFVMTRRGTAGSTGQAEPRCRAGRTNGRG